MYNSEGKIDMTIDELKERWLMFHILRKSGTYVIVEMFDNWERNFDAKNLFIELDGEYVMFDDDDGNIIKNSSTLMMFLREQLTKIEVVPDVQQLLYFGDYGNVLIKKVS